MKRMPPAFSNRQSTGNPMTATGCGLLLEFFRARSLPRGETTVEFKSKSLSRLTAGTANFSKPAKIGSEGGSSWIKVDKAQTPLFRGVKKDIYIMQARSQKTPVRPSTGSAPFHTRFQPGEASSRRAPNRFPTVSQTHQTIHPGLAIFATTRMKNPPSGLKTDKNPIGNHRKVIVSKGNLNIRFEGA